MKSEKQRLQELAGINEIKVHSPKSLEAEVHKQESILNDLIEKWYDKGDDWPIDVDQKYEDIRLKYNYPEGDVNLVKDKFGLLKSFESLRKEMELEMYGN